MLATSSHCSRLAFDGVWFGTHHLLLSFASRVRWRCGLAPTTSFCRLRLAFDGGVVWHPPLPSVVRVLRSMGVWFGTHHLYPLFASRVRWRCGLAPTTFTCRSRLASMEVWFGTHHLHLSFAARVRWVCALPATSSTCRSRLAFDGCVLCQPPLSVVRVSRSMRVCSASHLHPSFASRVRLGVWFASHLLFVSGVRWVCALPATSTRHLCFASDWVCGVLNHGCYIYT